MTIRNPFGSVRVWLGVILALIAILQTLKPIVAPELGALIEAIIGVLIVLRGMFPAVKK